VTSGYEVHVIQHGANHWLGASDVEIDDDEIDRPVEREQPVHDENADEASRTEEHPGLGDAFDDLRKASKSVAKRSTITGRSRTTKSVAEGVPVGPRSDSSCASSCSKNAVETRTTRLSAPIALPGDDSSVLEQEPASCTSPLQEFRGDIRQVGDEAFAHDPVTLVGRQPLKFLGGPDSVVGHRQPTVPAEDRPKLDRCC
jgi:hypothetical protein